MNADQHAEDFSKSISQWLKLKMKQKFNRDFNLDKEFVLHTEEGAVKIALTPETSVITQKEFLSLSFYVDQINNGEVSRDGVQNDLENIKY